MNETENPGKLSNKRILFIIAVLLICSAVIFAYMNYLDFGTAARSVSVHEVSSPDSDDSVEENVKEMDADLASENTIVEVEKEEDPVLEEVVEKNAEKLKAKREAQLRAERMKYIRPLGPLKKKIRKELKGKEGNWSVYVKNLASGEAFTIGNRAQRSASIIKLYTAGTYLRAVKKKVIKDNSDNAYDFEYMIKESSNDSWKSLEASLASAYHSDSQDVVNDFIYSYGFSQTYRDKHSLYGSATSVRDTGRLLDMAYHGKFVSKKASARLIKYMKMQDHRAKIPAGLPKGTVCANKTGELDTVDNDAAIIWTKYQDYILVVMADETNKKFLAVPEIVKISKMVYKYITGQ